MCDNEFEKEKLCYVQNYLQFRSLNQVMWQVPILAMTLTGGLWFGVNGTNDKFIQTILLIIAACGNFGLILVLTRTRFVMGEYLKKIEQFHQNSFVSANGNCLKSAEVVVNTFRVLLALSGVISVIAIVKMYFC